MQPVERSELVDYATYAEGRTPYRARAMAVKAARRIHVGPHLTYLFENRETIRYQIQEMLLAERIVKEAEIQHELQTYNELLGGPGELGATLLIEIEDPQERDLKLRRWLDLPQSVYARLSDGTRVRPSFDARQIDDGKLSSVHYVKFDLRGQLPVALGCELPELSCEVELSDEQRAALSADLG